jgi:hypothetical protein
MNVHISKELIDRYPTYEFLGKPIQLKNGIYIRAKHKILNKTMYYSFSEDFFWMDKEDFMTP